MPCGACQEFFYQLNEANEDMEIMVDYEKRETVTLKELMPNWWERNVTLRQRVIDNFQFIALFKNEKNRIRFAIDCKSSGFSI